MSCSSIKIKEGSLTGMQLISEHSKFCDVCKMN